MFYSAITTMRNFYLKYPIIQSVSGQLSWSHYCELLFISAVSLYLLMAFYFQK